MRTAKSWGFKTNNSVLQAAFRGTGSIAHSLRRLSDLWICSMCSWNFRPHLYNARVLNRFTENRIPSTYVSNVNDYSPSTRFYGPSQRADNRWWKRWFYEMSLTNHITTNISLMAIFQENTSSTKSGQQNLHLRKKNRRDVYRHFVVFEIPTICVVRFLGKKRLQIISKDSMKLDRNLESMIVCMKFDHCTLTFPTVMLIRLRLHSMPIHRRNLAQPTINSSNQPS